MNTLINPLEQLLHALSGKQLHLMSTRDIRNYENYMNCNKVQKKTLTPMHSDVRLYFNAHTYIYIYHIQALMIE